MRYDKRVSFQIGSPSSRYDPVSGEYIDSDEDVKDRICRVYDLSTERTVQVYGRANVGAKVVYHRGKALDVQTVKIDGKKYHVNAIRQVRGKASYIVSEVKT